MGIVGKLRKKTIGFWAGDQNNFQFVMPLVEELRKYYKVKIFEYEDDTGLLQQQLRSVDLAWFEWGNGPVVPASNMEHGTPIINRIHRYEIYSESPKHINWSRIDKTIFTSPSMIKRFEKKFPEENRLARPELVEIGVDTSLFTYVDKPLTKNLLYVGRIHPHKNPSLLLQVFAKLIQQDSEYHLTVIGGFSDELFEEFFYDQLDKLHIADNTTFLGKLTQPEIVEHYQRADYFIISSIIEGLSQASLEAMSCGARPVINNYYGSEKAYPVEYIYNTVDEAVEMILNPVSMRFDNRKFIEERYDLESKVRKVREIIDGLVKQ